jgi:hypothetical protein
MPGTVHLKAQKGYRSIPPFTIRQADERRKRVLDLR